MYKYLEIKSRGTHEVILRIDVTNKSERSIEKAEEGMNINLNHEGFFTNIEESETKLEEIKN